jgi:hypothetical protein
MMRDKKIGEIGEIIVEGNVEGKEEMVIGSG